STAGAGSRSARPSSNTSAPAAPSVTTTGAPAAAASARAAGALVFDDGRAERVPAPAVDVVDTTGAGDALCGTLAAELARGAGLGDAVRAAVEAASRSTTRPGAR
ncbi:MAG: PfkB family carbohydrate kinase, partial [Gaiellales bacterium]